MSDVSVRLTLNDEASAKLSRVANAGRNAASQMAQAGRAIDRAFNASSMDAFAGRVGEAMAEAEGDVESLGNALDEVSDSFESAGHWDMSGSGMRWIDDAAESADRAGRSMDEASESAREFVDSVGDAGQGADGLGQVGDEAEQAGDSMNDAGRKAIDFGSALKTLFGIAAGAKVLGEIKQYASDSIVLGKDYTSMMSEVQAISGASAGDMQTLEATAREYGATTVFSATDAAEALKYMSLAGWDVNQSTSALGGVLNLAAASGMELGQASDMVTDYLSAFGMEADKSAYFADMLSFAQSNSNTTAEQLGEAYRNSAANMHAAGQDVETTTSLLEAMANQGYKGSEAGTALAAVMRDITNKMDDGAIKIGDTSVAVQDAQGNFRDLTDILTDVQGATDGMGDAQKAAALGATFTADSIKGVNMLFAEGMDTVAGYEEALRSSSGAAGDMAGVMNDNLSGDIANMNSAFEEMQLQTFEAMEQPLRDITQYATSTVIPALTEWVPSAFESLASGGAKLGKALAPLFETVLKNPKAIGSAFASVGAGLLAFKGLGAVNNVAGFVSDAGGMTGALKKLAPAVFSHPWIAGAAAVTSAVAAIGLAVHEYNEMQIDNSLTEHFGSVELDDAQIRDFASGVIDAEWLVNINAALGHFENADEFYTEAEEALKENDSLEWKARVGITLTADERSNYISNIETYASNIEKSLEERTLAANMVVDEFNIKSADGTSLGSKIEEWANSDLQEVSNISAGLTNLVQTALEDGIIDVDEQAAIDVLQGKISNIMAGWKEAEAQAEMDVLTQKYGRLSGKDLTDDTFLKVVEEVGKQRETATAALEESEKKLYTTLNALNRADENGVQRISDPELADYKQQAGYAVRNEEASMLGNSLQFETNTLSDAYGKKLNENYSSIQESTGEFFQRANGYLESQDYGALFDSLQYGFNSAMTGTNLFSDKDQKALSNVFEAMKPDVDSMAGLIDEYRAMGQAVPQDVMNAFNDALMIGAAAGDTDAAWQIFANQMVADPANEALIQAIEEGTVNVPDELRTAIERATVETTNDPVTIEGMQADIDNVEVNEEHVNELIQQAFEGLEATENEAVINGTATVEYEVVAGNTLSGIAETVGTTVDELLKYNPQITNPDLINVGAKINVPKELVTVEASGVGEATEEAVKNETGETIEREQPTKTVLTDAGTDASQIADAAQNETAAQEPKETSVPTTIKFEVASLDDSALAGAISEKLKEGEAVPVSVPANVKIEAGTFDSTAAVSATKSELKNVFATPFPADGTTNVTLEKASDNISAIYSQVGSELQSAFNSRYSVSTSASIYVDYSIANPSKTISFSGGATGTATVYAHASGGIFEEPHYGLVAEAGPEAIIPLNGSAQALELWKEAGIRLGVGTKDGSSQAVTEAAPARDTGSGSVSKGASKDINININGSGRIGAGGGLSKSEILDVMIANIKDVLLGIIEQEILEEGDGVYEY